MKIIKKHKILILLLTLIILSFCLLVYRYINRDHRIINQIPKDQIEYLSERAKNCVFDEVITRYYGQVITPRFSVVNWDCSFFDGSTIKEGEDVTVKILSQDLEQGKIAFRAWLKENGLEESDKLRITYIHKPK